VLRTYEKGALHNVKTTLSLVAASDTTSQVDVRLDITPRTTAGSLVLRAGAGLFASRLHKVLMDMARYAAGTCHELGSETAHPVDPLIVAAAAHKRQELVAHGFSGEVVDKLIQHIASRPDYELGRIRPYEAAQSLGLTRQESLRLFLFGTRAGLLLLSWDVQCPHCRGANVKARELKSVAPNSACESCGIQYAVELDRNVEVTFCPHPAIRKVEYTRFCYGGPAATPHVRAQLPLAAGETRVVDLALAPSWYRLRASGVPGSVMLEVDANTPASAADVDVCIDPAHVSLGVPTVGPKMRLRLRNLGADATVLVVETAQWMEQAATAAAVTALQDFRDLFGREVIATGAHIRIGQVTLMFTDLKGSTALYEEVGDAKAYAMVHNHFRLLTAVIRECQGGIVKTIGDAVMAVFPWPADGVRCAIEVQKRAQDLKGHDGRDIVIKIGVHSGACLAVEENEKLDYFGNMVNIAARAQNESVGWDVILTDAALKDPNVQAEIAPYLAEPFDANLKGIAQRTRLIRLWPCGKR
jgi:class 3 adenylate cyclase